MSKLRLRWFSAVLLLGLSVFVLASCGKTTDTNSKVKGPYYITSVYNLYNSPSEAVVLDACGTEQGSIVLGHVFCPIGKKQLWQLIYQDDKFFKIKLCNSNLAISLDEKDQAVMVEDSDFSRENMLWRIEVVGDNSFILINKKDDKVLKAGEYNYEQHLFNIEIKNYNEDYGKDKANKNYYFKLYSPPVEATP